MKSKVKFFRGDAINLVNIISKFKINGVQLKSVMALLALKSEFVKLATESREYLNQTIEQLKPDNFEEVKEDPEVIKAINEQYAPIEFAYLNEEVEIEAESINVEDLFKMVQGNKDTELLVFELLKNKIGEKEDGNSDKE